MNIAFINPPFHPKYSRGSRSPAVTKSGTVYYPIWLALAAGFAEKKGPLPTPLGRLRPAAPLRFCQRWTLP